MNKKHHDNFDKELKNEFISNGGAKKIKFFRTYSRNADPSVAKGRVEMFRFLFNFINIVFFQELFKFFVTAFTLKYCVSTAVNARHIVRDNATVRNTALTL